jgi:hypothetical protein
MSMIDMYCMCMCGYDDECDERCSSGKVLVHVCACVCLYVPGDVLSARNMCMSIVRMHACMVLRMYACMCMCMSPSLSLSISVCALSVLACVYMFIRGCTCVRAYVCIYVCMYMLAYVCRNCACNASEEINISFQSSVLSFGKSCLQYFRTTADILTFSVSSPEIQSLSWVTVHCLRLPSSPRYLHILQVTFWLRILDNHMSPPFAHTYLFQDGLVC